MGKFVNTDDPMWLQQALQDASVRIDYLEAELAAIRDLAYRAGPGDAAADALNEIHRRASHAATSEA